MGRSTRLVAVVLACTVLLPALAFAQASITGTVKDATGALLPGVTVEASSPALIEKVRSVVTDGAGQYRIVDLRPGTYSVTFTLPGFNTVQARWHRAHGLIHGHRSTPSSSWERWKRRITVTGQIADRRRADRVAAARDQQGSHRRHSGRAWSVRAGRSHPGHGDRRSGRRRPNNQSLSAISIHGGRGTDQRQSVDGLTLRNVAGQGNSTNTVVDVGSSQEMTIDYAAGNAEAVTGGVLFNFIPKEGGNRFSGSFFGTHTNSDFQNSNYTR